MCNSNIAGYYEEPAPKKKKKKKKKKTGISGILEGSENVGGVLMSLGAGMLGGVLANKGTSFVVEKAMPDSSENMKRGVKNAANVVLGTVGAVLVPNKYGKALAAGVAIDGGVDGIAHGIEMYQSQSDEKKQTHEKKANSFAERSNNALAESNMAGTDDYEDRMYGTDDYEDRMHGTDDYEEHGVTIANILTEKEMKGDSQEEIKGVSVPVAVNSGRGNMPMY